VRVCVCVCVRERERERESVCMCVCVSFVRSFVSSLQHADICFLKLVRSVGRTVHELRKIFQIFFRSFFLSKTNSFFLSFSLSLGDYFVNSAP